VTPSENRSSHLFNGEASLLLSLSHTKPMVGTRASRSIAGKTTQPRGKTVDAFLIMIRSKNKSVPKDNL